MFTDDDSQRRQQSFSDADLKRLKERCKDDDLIGILDYELPALLARLEAAEAYIKSFESFQQYSSFRGARETVALEEAWRKAAGW